MAFGAGARNIVHLIVGHGLVLAVSGVVVGIVVALLLTRFVSSFLYDIAPNETQRPLIQAALDLKYLLTESPGVEDALCMWLKADDLTSLVDMDPVSTWDTSAGGGRFTETGAARPTYATNQSADFTLPMVQFRRSPDNERMESQDNYLQELGPNGMTVFIAGKPATISQSFNTWLASHSGSGSGNGNFYFRIYQAGGAPCTF